MKKVFITAFTIAAIAGCSHCTKNRNCISNRYVTEKFISSVSMFDDISHAGRFEFPENTCDTVELDCEAWRYLDSLGTDVGIVMSMRSSCDMMKAYVHQNGMALRAIAPQETVEALDRFEASFDTLFYRCVSQEYYLRLFNDCFDEAIPEALDSLVVCCRKFASQEPSTMNK